MKRYSASYVIREMQMTTTMSYCSCLINTARTPSPDPPMSEDVSDRNSHSLLVRMGQPLWKTVFQFLTRVNTLLQHHGVLVLPVIYPKKLKKYVHAKTCAWMFMAALFVIAKIWKQPTCPWVGEWRNTLRHIQPGITFSS